MSRTARNQSAARRITIRGARRKEPDVAKFARAVIGLALHQAALEAEAEKAVPRVAPTKTPGHGQGEVDA